jgi:hypothetical protein
MYSLLLEGIRSPQQESLQLYTVTERVSEKYVWHKMYVIILGDVIKSTVQGGSGN